MSAGCALGSLADTVFDCTQGECSYAVSAGSGNTNIWPVYASVGYNIRTNSIVGPIISERLSDFDDPSDEQFPSADTLARIPWPSRRPTLIDIAWIAGLYEGEGSASRGTITITQKEREILDRVQELVGGRVSGPHYRVKPSGEPTYQHKWWATGREGGGSR